MFREVPLPIIRSSFTVHLALVYVIQVCKTAFEQGLQALLENCLTNLYDIYQCQVYSE